jgi:hypothetical protein
MLSSLQFPQFAFQEFQALVNILGWAAMDDLGHRLLVFREHVHERTKDDRPKEA